VKTEADFEVKLLQAKGLQELPDIRRGKKRFSLRAMKGDVTVPKTGFPTSGCHRE
jgi:hypothetical protein